ncbi:alpha/beta fold hydrolase [Devosia sp.]|uniref:alpha/beta fold hydrolase n=1 Tax=Devosia sp. TaxID=1871048 RepID=UPI003A9065AA
MAWRDDDLTALEAAAPSLPVPDETLQVPVDGASIWCARFGAGPAVLLLHGGHGHSGNFAYQVPALTAAGYRVVTIDTRGHGRSTRDARPFSYRQLAADALAVLDHLDIDRAAIVGWSDGAVTGLLAAMANTERVAGLFFFACNVDETGTRPFEFTPVIGRMLGAHKRDYAALSATPDQFDTLFEDVGQMQSTQPNLTAADLATVNVPVWSVIGDGDEFITRTHAEYLAEAMPGARFRLLQGVTHFAPLQRPDVFNAAVLEFLAETRP